MLHIMITKQHAEDKLAGISPQIGSLCRWLLDFKPTPSNTIEVKHNK